tara:strand:+ start:13683 stop:14777 length:1095 start_codon:yes stop_codon:yes gene_type:complete
MERGTFTADLPTVLADEILKMITKHIMRQELLCKTFVIQMACRAWRKWALREYAEEARALLHRMAAGNDPKRSMYVPERHGLLYRLIDNLQHNPRAPGEHRFIVMGHPSAGKGNFLISIFDIMEIFGRVKGKHADTLSLYSSAADFRRMMHRNGSSCYISITGAFKGTIPKACLHAMKRDWLGMQNMVWFIEVWQKPWHEGCLLSRYSDLAPAVQNAPITQKEQQYWSTCTRTPFGTLQLPKMSMSTFTKMVIFKIENHVERGSKRFKSMFSSKQEVSAAIHDVMAQKGVVDEKNVAWLGGWLAEHIVRGLMYKYDNEKGSFVDAFKECHDEVERTMGYCESFGRIKACLRKSTSSDAERLGFL